MKKQRFPLLQLKRLRVSLESSTKFHRGISPDTLFSLCKGGQSSTFIIPSSILAIQGSWLLQNQLQGTYTARLWLVLLKKRVKSYHLYDSKPVLVSKMSRSGVWGAHSMKKVSDTEKRVLRYVESRGLECFERYEGSVLVQGHIHDSMVCYVEYR